MSWWWCVAGCDVWDPTLTHQSESSRRSCIRMKHDAGNSDEMVTLQEIEPRVICLYYTVEIMKGQYVSHGFGIIGESGFCWGWWTDLEFKFLIFPKQWNGVSCAMNTPGIWPKEVKWSLRMGNLTQSTTQLDWFSISWIEGFRCECFRQWINRLGFFKQGKGHVDDL